MKSTGLIIALFIGLSFCGLGCSAERTYEVTVRNDTAGPVTIWLYKDGGPFEEGWKSPEDLAIESPKANEPIGGRVIRPNVVASAGPIKGQFDSDSNAVLRAYRGAHSFNELLAINGQSGDRIDVKLEPGDNSFLIKDRDSSLAFYRVNEIPSTQP
jgi:hypothetical protein